MQTYLLVRIWNTHNCSYIDKPLILSRWILFALFYKYKNTYNKFRQLTQKLFGNIVGFGFIHHMNIPFLYCIFLETPYSYELLQGKYNSVQFSNWSTQILYMRHPIFRVNCEKYAV